MAILFPFPSSKARVRAMSSANWAEVPGGRGLASMVSKLETTAYPALLFPSKTKLLPSVYQISSGLVRGSSDNPSEFCSNDYTRYLYIWGISPLSGICLGNICSHSVGCLFILLMASFAIHKLISLM